MSKGWKMCRVYHLKDTTRLRNIPGKLFAFFWTWERFHHCKLQWSQQWEAKFTYWPSKICPVCYKRTYWSLRRVKKTCPFHWTSPTVLGLPWEELVVPAEAEVQECGMLGALGWTGTKRGGRSAASQARVPGASFPPASRPAQTWRLWSWYRLREGSELLQPLYHDLIKIMSQ